MQLAPMPNHPKASFCLTLLLHLKTLFLPIQNEHKEHISLPLLLLKAIALGSLQPLLQAEQPNPSLSSGCIFQVTSLEIRLSPERLTDFWLYGPHKQTAPGENFLEPRRVGLPPAPWRLCFSSSSSTPQHAFPQHTQSSRV